MHHTTATRGHWLIAIGAIVIVGSSFLQWWQIGGGVGELPARTGIGISEGRVFLMMFLPSVASVLLLTLPYVSEKPIGIDHPLSYLGLFALLLAGYVWNLVGQAQRQLVPWPPQYGFGFWLAAAGLVLFARGVWEVFDERRRRLY
jgi:hypothetical protein